MVETPSRAAWGWKLLWLFIPIAIVTLILMRPSKPDYEPTIPKVWIDKAADTTYSGGLAGIVLTPGGECTFQIDQELSMPLNFFDWRQHAAGTVIQIKVHIDRLGSIDEVALVDPYIMNPEPGNVLINHIQRYWKFKDACYWGYLLYEFNPTTQTVVVDDSKLREIIDDGWSGCERNVGHNLTYITSYNEGAGPRPRVVHSWGSIYAPGLQ